ncbi:EexN family lipoprotein [Ancylobacter vacuolatus]|uniref:EexN family lipoprotein n=1 Tax=Ancylobacter vacuolatus TaxID=223389 RepID=UPI00363BFB08
MRMIGLPVMLAIGFALAACSESKVYSVEELAGNDDLIVQVLRECNNNPGELEKGPNCQNARAALRTMNLNKSGPLLRRAEGK